MGAGWDRKLSRSVVPTRGEAMHTLADARAFILALPRGIQNQDDWQHAADLLMAAADSTSERDIEQATFQLEHALLFYKLLAPR